MLWYWYLEFSLSLIFHGLFYLYCMVNNPVVLAHVCVFDYCCVAQSNQKKIAWGLDAFIYGEPTRWATTSVSDLWFLFLLRGITWIIGLHTESWNIEVAEKFIAIWQGVDVGHGKRKQSILSISLLYFLQKEPTHFYIN